MEGAIKMTVSQAKSKGYRAVKFAGDNIKNANLFKISIFY